MDFTALKTEFSARGYDYLADTRQGYYVNRGYHECLERHPWPFCEKEATAQTAPFTLSDLRQVLYMVDTTNDQVLTGDDQRTVRSWDPDLTSTGNPYFWYLESNEVNLYPPNTSAAITCRYLYVPADLSGGTDTPILPTRYHTLIVDRAVVEALKDNDEYSTSREARSYWEQEIDRAATHFTHRNYQNNSTIASTTFWVDGNV